MTPEQIARFRRRLEEQRAQAQSRIAAERDAADEPLDVPIGDLGDEAVRDVLAATALGLGEPATREIEEIDDALLRLEQGDYGTCEICGRPIELVRLERMPSARLCQDDAQRADTGSPPKL